MPRNWVMVGTSWPLGGWLWMPFLVADYVPGAVQRFIGTHFGAAGPRLQAGSAGALLGGPGVYRGFCE